MMDEELGRSPDENPRKCVTAQETNGNINKTEDNFHRQNEGYVSFGTFSSRKLTSKAMTTTETSESSRKEDLCPLLRVMECSQTNFIQERGSQDRVTLEIINTPSTFWRRQSRNVSKSF